MESSILPCKSPPSTFHFFNQQEIPPQFSSKPLKSTNLSLTKKTHTSSSQQSIMKESQLIHLCRNGKLKEAVIGLDIITKQGHKVRPKTYLSLLNCCIYSKCIEQGRLVHAQIGKLNKDPLVITKLISMYAKCGSLDDARRVFDEMRDRSMFTWTALINGYSREKRWREVIELFFLMMEEGVTLPDDFLLPRIVQACANLGDIETGKLIHSLVIRSGLGIGLSCLHVNNTLLSMYAKCGDLKSTRRFFEKMEFKDGSSWNSVISGYCRSCENEEAFRLFGKMQENGIEPNLITWNTLISSYNQCGNPDLALQLMNKMTDGHGVTPDLFTWTSMISGLAQNKRYNHALELFGKMLEAGVEPNEVTIASALSASASLKVLNKGMEIHSMGIKIGTMGDVLVRNSLIDMYCKCGKLDAAHNIFDMIKEKDVITWNSMIGGYSQAGYCGKAYDLFTRMKDSGVHPNVVTWNVMISGYIQKGDEDQAMDLFLKMKTDGMTKPDTASWNLLISGLLQNRENDKAFRIFRQMQSFCNEPPNAISVLSILAACANLIAAKKVKEIHCYRLRRLRFERDISVENSLMNKYAMSGDIASARAIFENLPTRDLTSWNRLISGYVLHGWPSIAFDLFDRMRLEGFTPSKGTFASIISAYSLSGMVEQGKNAFSIMTTDYQISPSPEHCLAMVDLLSRSGRLEEAIGFIEERSIEHYDSAVWEVLLTACRMHGNIKLAILAAERIFEMHWRNSLIYSLLLQLYSLNGMSEEVSRMKKQKSGNMAEISPGCSWTEVNNTVHSFTTGDLSHSRLYAQLGTIEEEIRNVVLPPNHHEYEAQLCIDEEEKEEISGVHSEKLAISFVLVASPYKSQSIRIMKNFRMCRECHRIAKLISLKYEREIYLHDSKCLHHFKQGHCSCKDYW